MNKFLLVCLIFASALSSAHAAEKRETLALDAAGVSALRIECGAGYLKVQGSEEAKQVEVVATLHVQGIADDGIAGFRKEHVVLTLEKTGGKAVLVAKIDEKFRLEKLFGSYEAYIDLDVHLPRRLGLAIEDGSGNLSVRDMANGLELQDGSGDVSVEAVSGPVKIDDGSGSLRLAHLEGNVKIEDGSGDIELQDAGGDVSIDDGSGEIDLRGVRGSVTIDDGSGAIVIDGVDGDVTIDEAGSGGVEIRNVKGRVKK